MTHETSQRKLRYAMVGGGRDAFIGAVHRKAIALDGQVDLVAGALSSSPEKAKASGRDLFLADDRNHGDWQSLLDDELKRPLDERIDFVSIVTPNHVHSPVAKAFVDAGFHVVCDKPLVHTGEQADALVAAVARQGTVFGGAGAKGMVKTIMDGKDPRIQADVSYSPKFIYDAIKLTAEARLKGEKMPATTIIPSVLITKDNA